MKTRRRVPQADWAGPLLLYVVIRVVIILLLAAAFWTVLAKFAENAE